MNDEELPGMAWLHSRIMLGMKAGLETIRELCARLGDPQRGMAAVHVVGSNGKGSTASMAALMLSRAGFRAGLFTSPHLVSVRERFRVDGEPIPADELERTLLRVRDASESAPALPTTFFEAVTAAALLWFRERGVDVAVLEAGLGGRLDSTNVVDAPLSALTGISLEHVDILGSTEEAILGEKLGVMRRGGLCLHALPPRLLPAAARLAEQGGYRLSGVRDREWSAGEDGELRCAFSGRTFPLGTFPGSPEAMQRNRVLAAMLFEAFCASRPDDPRARAMASDPALLARMAAEALREHVWPARLQAVRPPRSPEILVDGAHNPESASCLAAALELRHPGRKLTVVMGVVRDKNLEGMLDLLLPHAARFLFVRTPYPRFRDPEELRDALAGRAECELFGSDVRAALDRARALGDPAVVCGSLYLTGAAIAALAPECDELAWFRQFVPDANETR